MGIAKTPPGFLRELGLAVTSVIAVRIGLKPGVEVIRSV